MLVSSKKLLLMGPTFCAIHQMTAAHVEAGTRTSLRSQLFAMSLEFLSKVVTLYGSMARGEQGHTQTFQSFDWVAWGISFLKTTKGPRQTLAIVENHWQLIFQTKVLNQWSWPKKEPECVMKRVTSVLKTGAAWNKSLGMVFPCTVIACMQSQS